MATEVSDAIVDFELFLTTSSDPASAHPEGQRQHQWHEHFAIQAAPSKSPTSLRTQSNGYSKKFAKFPTSKGQSSPDSDTTTSN